MARILTGIQSTGALHLGNVLGAIRPAIALSNDTRNESFLFIADLHSLTQIKDPALLRSNTYGMAATWLACGLDVDGDLDTFRLAGAGINPSDIQPGDQVILDARFVRAEKLFEAERVASVNPIVTAPLIPRLEERARNLYFHVPSAWVAQIAWFVAFGFPIAYLRKRKIEHDIIASSAAALGGIFCLLATITGSVWARFNWGTFWTWDDPRLISITIVLIVFGAYFALRSAIENQDQRGRISAVYMVILVLPVTFFMFVYPRIAGGLHPGY